MATSKAQRIGISIILAVTVIGTIGSFFVMVLAQQNQTKDAAKQQEQYAKYQQVMKDYNDKVQAQADQLSTQYYPTFSQYASYPAKYAIDSVKELKTTDIVVGTGTEVKDDTAFAAYYIGWNPDGKVFDQSIDGTKLKAPIAIPALKNASLIEGWKKGMIGMKIGGVRELDIPSDQAYGSQAKGNDIPANTPLKFVVMAVDKPADIPTPDLSSIFGTN